MASTSWICVLQPPPPCSPPPFFRSQLIWLPFFLSFFLSFRELYWIIFLNFCFVARLGQDLYVVSAQKADLIFLFRMTRRSQYLHAVHLRKVYGLTVKKLILLPHIITHTSISRDKIIWLFPYPQAINPRAFWNIAIVSPFIRSFELKRECETHFIQSRKRWVKTKRWTGYRT